MKHTPGPWKTEINISVHRPCVRAGKDETWEVSASAIGNSTANARLIAAAPDLLEACKAVVKYHQENDSGEGELFGLDFVTTCIAAIRKVEGGGG
jgi:hypothetical protein